MNIESIFAQFAAIEACDDTMRAEPIRCTVKCSPQFCFCKPHSQFANQELEKAA